MNRRSQKRAKVAVAAMLAIVSACNTKGGGSTTPGSELEDLAFETRVDIDCGARGLGQTIVEDFNGDGLVDFAVASWTDLAVCVAMGDASGGFALVPSLPTPSSPLVLAAGDLDGDGVLELVAATVDDGGTALPTLVVFELDPALGLFTQSYTTSLPSRPTSLAVGSIDATGEDHVFVALEEQRAVWQYALAGPHVIQFVQAHDSTSLPADGAAVTCALVDARGDGPLDLVVGERAVHGGAPDRVVWFENDGNGAFAAPIELPMTLAWPVVLAVDADGDPWPDLAVAQLDANDVFLLHGDASAGWGAPVAIAMLGAQFSVEFADFDLDGRIDVAAPLYAQGAVAVRRQLAPDVYDAPTYFNVGNGARSLIATRLPGDQRVDLVCGSFDAVSLLRGRKDATFEAMRGFPVGLRPQYVRCADFDADGAVDAVSVDQFQQAVVFQRGLGDGTFAYVAAVPLSQTATETPGYLVVDDFDEDGLPDVMASVLEDAALQLMRNDGSLPLHSLRVDRIPVGNRPLGLASGRLDEDEHVDVVVANSLDRTVQVLFGNGDGTFDSGLPIPLADQPLTMLIADLDGDDENDIALSMGEFDGSSAKLLLWRGDGEGLFALANSIPLNSTALVLNAGDFDRDGRPDLTLSQFGYSATSVVLLINQGGFQFAPQAVTVGNNPGTVEVADVDIDGDDDLIVPLGIGRLRVLLGDGDGGFETSAPEFELDLPAPFSTNASAWRDVDGDQLPDLLLIGPDSPHLWVSRNQSR